MQDLSLRLRAAATSANRFALPEERNSNATLKSFSAHGVRPYLVAATFSPYVSAPSPFLCSRRGSAPSSPECNPIHLICTIGLLTRSPVRPSVGVTVSTVLRGEPPCL